MKEVIKNLKIYQWIIIILMIVVNVFIIVNSCLPGGASTSESNWIVKPVVDIINSIKPGTIDDTNVHALSSFIRKFIGHFSLFVVSGILTTLSIKYLYYNNKQKFVFFVVFAGISGLFLAILTELIQLFVPGRSGEIKDVMIDYSGYLLALIVIGLIVYFREQKTSNIEKLK